MAYRPDIDGLRAIAVLAVVVFHAAPGALPGGFVGVDVFFVISGFLITGLIHEELANNRFSFTNFYARRIRRIFPALILVLVFCLALGRTNLLEKEYVFLGRHIAASASFVENLLLWTESGYFDIASELKPLNHLWSLAIEEQFYLLFPLLIWLAWRLRIRPLLVVAVICATSFLANLHAMKNDPVGDFFGIHARAWELMVGSSIALSSARIGTSLVSLPLRSVLSVAGLLSILIGCALLDSAVSYPGFAALLPVMGAALLIVSGPSAWANRHILSKELPRFIGLISYPLYLWHWPLLSFLTIVDGSQPPLDQRAIAVALSFGLAWLTFVLVERPIRQTKKLHVSVGLCAIAVILLGLGLRAYDLFPVYDQRTRRVMQEWEFGNYPAAENMYKDDTHGFWTVGHNPRNRILFWGDSHADQYQYLMSVVQKRASEADPGAPEVMFPPNTAFPPEASADILHDRTISAVALSYYWAINYYSEKVNQPIRCCGKGLMGTVGKRVTPFTSGQMDALDAKLAQTIRALRSAGKQVYLVLDNPFGEEFSPRSIVKRSFFRGLTIEDTPVPRQTALERTEPVRSRLLSVARQTDARIIDPFDYLCDGAGCPVLSSEGIPINKDYDHLSRNTVERHVRYLDVLGKPGQAE